MAGAARTFRISESEESGMDRDDLRIGDAEREQTMAALREHFALGRLDHEELDQRLDQTLTARTHRDLAQVTADLPGPDQGHREPAPRHDVASWQEAMRAHRQQMRQHRPGKMRGPRRPGPPWQGRRGPGPILPFLFVLLMVGLVVGGTGLFKVLFFIWIGAMIFAFVSRRLRHRG